MSVNTPTPDLERRRISRVSRSSSVVSIDSIITQTAPPLSHGEIPRTQSETTLVEPRRPAVGSRSSSSPTVGPFRGYASEDAYLASLIEFGKSKGYLESDHQLIGYYGKKTIDQYIEEGGGWRNETRQQRAARKEEKARRKRQVATAGSRATLPALVEEDAPSTAGEATSTARTQINTTAGESQNKGFRRMSQGFAKVFSRRGTVA